MKLFHYRKIDSALREIEEGTFHFSSREEVNDPIEGYVSVFWQGDKPAWEGLFRNYALSLLNAINIYLLDGNENQLLHNTIMVDMHRYDNAPFGDVIKKLGNTFIMDECVQEIASYYGNSYSKVCEKELRVVLRFIHLIALAYCIREERRSGTISPADADNLLTIVPPTGEILKIIRVLFSGTRAQDGKLLEAEKIESEFVHLNELKYGQLFFKENTKVDESVETEAVDKESCAEQRKKWIAVWNDFPNIYVNQLKDLIYPESYFVCFSRDSSNSAMWGNYASNHQGICLVYETNEDNKITLYGSEEISLSVKPVRYGGDVLERNFFNSLGRLTFSQIESWLTGNGHTSKLCESYRDKVNWRTQYWEVYEAKTFRKLKDWEHENEYRIDINNSFYDYTEKEKRNFAFKQGHLKGVIFGIRTSVKDKIQIFELIKKQINQYEDFTFYQAEYDEKKQVITIEENSVLTQYMSKIKESSKK